MKKGRAVLASERPTYDALHRLMLEGRIYFWTVPAKDQWIIWHTEEQFGTLQERTAGTDGGFRCDLAGAQETVARLDPTAATPIRARASVTTLRSLLRRLADAAESGNVHPDLLTEARAA